MGKPKKLIFFFILRDKQTILVLRDKQNNVSCFVNNFLDPSFHGRYHRDMYCPYVPDMLPDRVQFSNVTTPCSYFEYQLQ